MRGYPAYRRQINRIWIVRIFKLALLVGVTALFCIAANQMQSMLTSLATAKVSNTVTQIVTQAVNDEVDEGSFDYQKLITFEKDNNGMITAVKSNMPEFNRLQAQILNAVLDRISEVSTRDLSIPVGTLTGVSLLAGRGPLVTVKMQSVGTSNAYLKNEFTSAGINQTKHQIVLYVDVYVNILLPGFATATEVSNHFTVAETVIVGSVPNSYTYFSSSKDSSEEEASEFIINGN